MKLQGKDVLVIDDTQAIRTFLTIMLQAEGATVREAGTANDGLRLAREAQPDIVVLDLGLPDRDGLDILPELKHDLVSSAVVILSVRKDQYTKDRARELGADSYLSKPFRVEDLLETLHGIGA